ncbi:hypothetical protein HPP92_011699 [Vanilla planifolia]|uniref:Uncharacterized protein n=1 Tax=Vanilla planifolia TaxID=51239 RepID=A0A835R150_VANPL|nr:hypothetical protein HPP92_011699 [Vanilla planifolia]
MQVEKKAAEEDRGGGAEAVLSLGSSLSIPICYHSSFGLHDDLFLSRSRRQATSRFSPKPGEYKIDLS